MAEKNIGKITQIIGAVLDIKYADGHLPEINEAIEITVMQKVSCMRLPHLRTANMIPLSSIIWWKQRHWTDTHWIRPSMK